MAAPSRCASLHCAGDAAFKPHHAKNKPTPVQPKLRVPRGLQSPESLLTDSRCGCNETQGHWVMRNIGSFGALGESEPHHRSQADSAGEDDDETTTFRRANAHRCNRRAATVRSDLRMVPVDAVWL